MKKRILSLLCALTLLLGLAPAAAAQEGESRRAASALASLQVIDAVPSGEALSGPATRAQAVNVLARLYGLTKADLPSGAYDYASSKGWVTVLSGQEDPIPTSEFCAALLRQLGYEGFTNENAGVFARRIALTARDYGETLTLGDLYQLARDALTFPGRDGVTPARRLVEKGLCTQAQIRSMFPEELTIRRAADRHMAAILRLDVFYSDEEYEDGKRSNGGSGFFVSADGLAVTNYHTIESALYATATLVTGETFDVEKVIFYDRSADLALLRISKTTTDRKTTVPFFHYLELAQEPDLRVGDQVYSMGVPLGVTLSATSGVVSAVNHRVGVGSFSSLPCVISTADISHGSSGGALVNVYGHVVGVTTGAYANGNNLYLSVPLTLVMEADWTAEGITLKEVAEQVEKETASAK